ncbi:MAG: hypothetical protein H0V19_09035 [Euzebyales bacterium]|nr:hypothetical protein [Euzebyales bacterium]
MTDTRASGPVNRTLLIALAAVAALALLFFFVVRPLLLTEEGDAGTDIDVTGQPSEGASPGVALGDPDSDADERKGKPGGRRPGETFEVFNARDPFQQLVSDAAPESAGADGEGGAGDDGTDGTVDGGTGATDGTVDGGTGATDGTVDGGTGATDGTVDGGEAGADDRSGDDATVGGTTVTLVDAFTSRKGNPKATVTVNATGYIVREGEVFADRLQLLEVSQECSTLRFGDSCITLCEGEQIRK